MGPDQARTTGQEVEDAFRALLRKHCPDWDPDSVIEPPAVKRAQEILAGQLELEGGRLRYTGACDWLDVAETGAGGANDTLRLICAEVGLI